MDPRQEESPESSCLLRQDTERSREYDRRPDPPGGWQLPSPPDLQAQSCEELLLLLKPPGLCSSRRNRAPAASGTGHPALGAPHPPSPRWSPRGPPWLGVASGLPTWGSREAFVAWQAMQSTDASEAGQTCGGASGLVLRRAERDPQRSQTLGFAAGRSSAQPVPCWSLSRV